MALGPYTRMARVFHQVGGTLNSLGSGRGAGCTLVALKMGSSSTTVNLREWEHTVGAMSRGSPSIPTQVSGVGEWGCLLFQHAPMAREHGLSPPVIFGHAGGQRGAEHHVYGCLVIRSRR